MNKLSFFKLVILIATISNFIYADGGNRVGTAGSTQLLIPVGPRGIAMGQTGLVDSKGIEGMFWNPASVALDSGSSVMFSHMNYLADIGVEYGALAVNVGNFGTIGFSIKSLSIGDIEITTADLPDGTGQFFKPQFITTGLTYSVMLSDRVSIGVTGNLNMERLALVSKSNLSFNAGIIYSNLGNINGLVLGVAIKNLGPQSNYSGEGLNIKSTEMLGYSRTGDQFYKIEAATEDLPTTLELGIGYRYSIGAENTIRLNGVFQNSNYFYDEYRVGLEYAYNNMIFLRGGYVFTPGVSDQYAKQNSFAAGFGIKVGLSGLNIAIDYTFQKRELFEDNHIFGIILTF